VVYLNKQKKLLQNAKTATDINIFKEHTAPIFRAEVPEDEDSMFL
jgi:hypothetical protein